MPRTLASKSELVVAGLRREIVAGKLAPGAKLPTWSQMQDRFGVTRPTLTRAMDRLKQDGLVFSDSTRGTFVHEYPPHLHRYALVFGQSPGRPGWNRFWAAIADQAQRCDLDDAVRQFPAFYDVTGEPHNPGYRRLRREVRAGRVAGLIVVGTDDAELMNMPELVDEQIPLPRVTVYEDPVAGVPTVAVDHQSFIDKSLDAVVEAGCRSVAVITADTNPGRFAGYRDAIAARGLHAKPHWFLASSARHTAAVSNVVHLLLDGHADKPDALIVTDDNLVQAAAAGVIASRTVVPDDLTLITHCNWPEPAQSPLPVVRLGYDVRDVFAACVDCIDIQRHGESCEPITRVVASFEGERGGLARLRANS